MKNWVADVHRYLEQGKPVVMSLVVNQDGSTPRAAGTRMVLGEGRIVSGTVGGGWIEAEVLRLSRDILGSRKAVLRSFDLTSEVADKMDMICGGKMEILLESLNANAETILFFSELLDMLNHRRKGVMITELTPAGASPLRISRMILQEDGKKIGYVELSKAMQSDIGTVTDHLRAPVLKIVGDRRLFIEPIYAQDTVYLLGAGHVSLQTAIFTRMVGFRTVVLDDRDEFANRSRFPEADEVEVLSSFDRAFEGRIVHEDAYIVILTRGHLHDKTVLAQALRTPAGYIGMIGSRKKRDAIYSALETEGFSAADFKRVHSPIGLSIGAQTPEEIAVSITAELIQVRSCRYAT